MNLKEYVLFVGKLSKDDQHYLERIIKLIFVTSVGLREATEEWKNFRRKIKKKADNINSKCKKGWKFDTDYFVYHSKNALLKYVQLDEEHLLQFTLKYNSKRQIILHITKFDYNTKTGMLSTYGMGKEKMLNELPAKKENINQLIELANKLDNKELLKLDKQAEMLKSNRLFLESEEF